MDNGIKTTLKIEGKKGINGLKVRRPEEEKKINWKMHAALVFFSIWLSTLFIVLKKKNGQKMEGSNQVIIGKWMTRSSSLEAYVGVWKA